MLERFKATWRDPSVHYLKGDEIRALRKLPSGLFRQQICVHVLAVRTVITERPVKMVAGAGVEAGLELSVHLHMLRYESGYQVA